MATPPAWPILKVISKHLHFQLDATHYTLGGDGQNNIFSVYEWYDYVFHMSLLLFEIIF